MDLDIRRGFSLTLIFFWTLYFVRIPQYESLTSWHVDICPGNQSEVEAATLRLNCSDMRESINVYHCLPLSNLSGLVEFCYDATSGLIEAGNCMVLNKETLDNYPCGLFTNGCPNAHYFPKNMHKYSACLNINTKNSCYIADPKCPYVRFLETTSLSSVTAMVNKTQIVEATTAINNKSLRVETSLHGNDNDLLEYFIPISLGLLFPLITIALAIFLNLRRNKPDEKDTPEEQKLLDKDDSFSATKTKVDNKANRVAAIFKNKGTSFKFDELRLKLIGEIPETKLNSLKGSVKVITQMDLSVENVTTVEGFFTLILNEGIFSQQNVILMQYLLKSIGRPDLEKKCVDYARKEKVSCFFKEPEYPGNGRVYVQLHVNDDIEKLVEKDELFETVAKIADCDISCIEKVGLHPGSFIIVISMKEEFAKKLVQKDQREFRKLLKYKVDWIKVGDKVIEIVQGSKRKIENTEVLDDRLKKYLTLEKIEGSKRKIENTEVLEDQLKKELRIEKIEDVSTSLHLGPSLVPSSSITVPGVEGVNHISCVTSNRLWISDQKRLLQVDSTGHVIQEMEIKVKSFPYYPPTGAHSVTDDGDLIFINDDKVQKMTLDGTITTLLERHGLLCIHSSHNNGDILVGYETGVSRYEWTGANHIKLECEVRSPIFITENKNEDIWVSDYCKMAVVVMNKSGQYRFNYRGQHQSSFGPHGICTDINGQVLVCDRLNFSVHLVDKDGQFQRLLLTKEHGLNYPKPLCLDDKHNLYVGQGSSNTIKVYKYLQETEDSKSFIV